jgi:hypothetical protein
MTLDNERVKKLSTAIRELSQHIDWLLPFLDKKAKESGDVAGMRANARRSAEAARGLLRFYEAEDAVKAKSLSDE